MRRRSFVGGVIVSPWIVSSCIDAAAEQQEFTAGSMVFRWSYEGGRIYGMLSAGTLGWFAVGFNNFPRPKDIRFVIATVSSELVRAKEHIALVPDHRNVASLGLVATLRDVDGRYTNGRSSLFFPLE